MKYDIDGTGEREYIASAYTLMLYEQEFGSQLIGDCYGKINLATDNGEVVTAQFVEAALQSALPPGKTLPKATQSLVREAFPRYVERYRDYTQEHYEAILRAMWAMRKTADEAAGEAVVPYKAWLASLGAVNLQETSLFVFEETQRGLFRAAS